MICRSISGGLRMALALVAEGVGRRMWVWVGSRCSRSRRHGRPCSSQRSVASNEICLVVKWRSSQARL